MGSKIRVFIYGSCVSRDFIEISGADNFELVDYFARSSFASIGACPIDDFSFLRGIESKFQRRMVERDLNKSIFSRLNACDFDVLLIDLIDERFAVADYCGSLCTVSSEFKKYQKKPYGVIPFDSETKFDKWKVGVEKFFDFLRACGLVDRVRINKVFWAKRTSLEDFPCDLKSLADRNNNLLVRMYGFLERFVNKNQFVEYPECLVVAASSHKWGVQPFHYCDEFYYFTKIKLESEMLITREELLPASGLGSNVVNVVSKFMGLIKSLSPLCFLREAMQFGKISLDLDGKVVNCYRSFVFEQKNYLCFFDERGVSVVLEQRHLFVSSVIFLRYGLVVKIDYAPFDIDKVIAEVLCVENRFLMRGGESAEGARFKGVFLSYGRPYHYYYDLLPAFYDSVKNWEGKEKLNLVLVKDLCFIDCKRIFGGLVECSDVFYPNEAVLNQDLSDSGFVVKVGYPVVADIDLYRANCIKSFDDFLLGIFDREQPVGNDARGEFNEFTLWVGVCVEKREWREQINGIKLCVEEAARKFDRVTVLVDGITAPLGGWIEKPVRLIDKEIKVFEAIRSFFVGHESRIIFKSLIGEESWVKICEARKSDFFIAGFLTDSMYPARFGNCSGIGHGSYAARYTDHFHPRTLIMKSNKKRDESIFLKKSNNWARQSYSIRSGEVLDKFKEFLDS